MQLAQFTVGECIFISLPMTLKFTALNQVPKFPTVIIKYSRIKLNINFAPWTVNRKLCRRRMGQAGNISLYR